MGALLEHGERVEVHARAFLPAVAVELAMQFHHPPLQAIASRSRERREDL
jgi:hypothetical protein